MRCRIAAATPTFASFAASAATVWARRATIHPFRLWSGLGLLASLAACGAVAAGEGLEILAPLTRMSSVADRALRFAPLACVSLSCALCVIAVWHGARIPWREASFPRAIGGILLTILFGTAAAACAVLFDFIVFFVT